MTNKAKNLIMNMKITILSVIFSFCVTVTLSAKEYNIIDFGAKSDTTFLSTRAATIAAAEMEGPVYLRFGRPVVPVFTAADQVFEIGKAWKVNEGKDVSIFATGHLVWESIKAGELLAEMGIDAEIINIHTIKPLDEEAVLESVGKTRCVVSAEEHNRLGGLGDSIAQLLIRKDPVPMEYVAVDDSFGESGTPEELMEKYGLDAAHIVNAVIHVMKRK